MATKSVTHAEPMKLFEPIKIGPVRIKNRVAMAPMNCLYAEPGGYVGEQVMAWYASRAKGGVGLVITECTMATAMASKFDFINNLKLWNITHMAGMTELAETVHFFGAKVFIQMCMGFGNTGHTTLSGERSPAPSAIGYEIPMENMPRGLWKESASLIPRLMKGDIPREYTVAEIQSEQDAFANSARLAVMAGFDGIEIHSPHGYLLHQFLSPRFNQRTDQYGGSLENRQRCLFELYGKTREAVGHSIAIGVRASAQEYMPDGITLNDTKVLVQRLEELGVDYFHLSNGSYEAMNRFFPEKDDANMEDAKQLREKVKKMPILTPNIHDPELAEKAIREGVTDMVSQGRQLIADPEWANKIANGDFKGINKCIRCNACCLSICLGKHVRCTVNPDVGREKYMPQYIRPSRPKGQPVIVPPQAMAMVEEMGMPSH